MDKHRPSETGLRHRCLRKLRRRLAGLSTLSDGWADGEGKAPSLRALERAGDVLSCLIDRCPDLVVPPVYPTPEGGLQAEWYANEWHAEVLFDDAGNVEFSASSVDPEKPWHDTRISPEVGIEDASSLIYRWIKLEIECHGR